MERKNRNTGAVILATLVVIIFGLAAEGLSLPWPWVGIALCAGTFVGLLIIGKVSRS